MNIRKENTGGNETEMFRIYIEYGMMMLIPALFALFIHNYICHKRTGIRRKSVLAVIYIFLTFLLMNGAAWLRGIRGLGIAYMTLTHKIEFTILGCVMDFFVSLAVCLFAEPGVSFEKLRMYLSRFWKDVIKYFTYAVEAARAELRSEVANAYLDWLWWLIEPFCKMLIYTFIFGIVFNAAEPYFPIFIFSGLTMWNFFSRGMNVSVNVVRNNKSVISKVYLPKFILYFSRMLVNGFKMAVSFVIVVVMMLFFRVPVSANILYVLPLLAVFFLFTFGVGSILIHFGVYVNDLSYIVGIVLSMLMYLTGIFYSVGKRIPAPYGELLEKLNPVAYCIASVRNALLYSQGPQIDLLFMWGLVSAVLLAIGVYMIYRNENAYVKVI